MKEAFFFLLVVALNGCAANRAIVPSLEGKPRVKINDSATNAPAATPIVMSVETLDFTFSGDIHAAIKMLRTVQPQINLVVLSGKPFPLNVNMNLRGVTLEETLRSIANQGGGAVDVIWSKSQHQNGYQILVRYKSPKE